MIKFILCLEVQISSKTVSARAKRQTLEYHRVVPFSAKITGSRVETH